MCIYTCVYICKFFLERGEKQHRKGGVLVHDGDIKGSEFNSSHKHTRSTDIYGTWSYGGVGEPESWLNNSYTSGHSEKAHIKRVEEAET